jgi:hypothetical protein
MRRSVLGLLTALCLLWTVPAQATIALVAHTAAQSSTSNGVTSGAIDTTGSTLLVLCVSAFVTTPGTISDSKSNTWVAGAATSSANDAIFCFYVKNPTVGSGHTFTDTATGNFATIFVASFSGTDTTANTDQSNSSGGTPGAGTVQPGSVTPTTNNQVLVTAVSADANTQTLSINAGFTITDQVNSFTNGYTGAMAYLVQGTAAAVNPTWTSTNGTEVLQAAINTFKASAAAASRTSDFFIAP